MNIRGMAVLALAGLCVQAVAAPVPEVETEAGIVRGYARDDGSAVFASIPYARPPVGALRWKPPAPPAPWSGVRDATAPAPACPQREANGDLAKGSREDCLYLSVVTPPHRAGDRLAVMVYIHGGSNRTGTGAGIETSAIPRQGVVLVSLQYRLGVLGFLAAPALSAETATHTSGNYGLMDQIAALAWVKRNIAAFGGDPDNVTAFGQSAGAGDIDLLLTSPLAHGLFRKAIEESGTANRGHRPRSLAESEAIGTALARRLGLADTAEGLKALRTMPAATLLAVEDSLRPVGNLPPSFVWMQTTIDGHVLAEDPAAVFARGAQIPVPLLIGNVAREYAIEPARRTPKAWLSERTGSHTAQALAHYGLTDAPADEALALRLSTDVVYRCPSSWVGRHQAGHAPVWRYEFVVPGPASGGILGHGAELGYVFDARPDGADAGTWPPVQGYWTNFAKSGDPNGPGLPLWPRYGAEGRMMAFAAAGPRAETEAEAPCAFFDSP